MEVIFAKRLLLSALSIMFTLMFDLASASDEILILKTDDEFLSEVVNGIDNELEGTIRLHVIELTEGSSVGVIKDAIVKTKPKLVVLLGNMVIRNYIDYQMHHPSETMPPALLVAALYVDQLVPQLNNATGIRYEIPVVTSAVNLRDVYVEPITKIGVIHREWLSDFIELNAQFCRAEGVDIVSVKLPNKSQKFERLVARNLKELSSKVDAFWIVNDNTLLTRELLMSAWIPKLGKANKPVIVGVEALVETKLKLGTLSVSPDHYALGIQAGSKIFDIRDQEWSVANMEVDQPLSVTKILNLNISKDRKLKINDKKLDDIDRIIE